MKIPSALPVLLAVSLFVPLAVRAADAKLIPLTSEMIQTGSGDIEGLIDEQALGENGDPTQPAEKPWKPDVAGGRGNYPMEIIIDLGQERALSHIMFYDMNGIGNFAVAAGGPDEWQDLFVEDGGSYLTWKRHAANTRTRYLRLTKEDGASVFGELLIYEAAPAANGAAPAAENEP